MACLPFYYYLELLSLQTSECSEMEQFYWRAAGSCVSSLLNRNPSTVLCHCLMDFHPVLLVFSVGAFFGKLLAFQQLTPTFFGLQMTFLVSEKLLLSPFVPFLAERLSVPRETAENLFHFVLFYVLVMSFKGLWTHRGFTALERRNIRVTKISTPRSSRV